MILAHHQPAMVARLVDRLQHPDVVFVIHIDARRDERPFRAALGYHPNVSFVAAADRVPVHWFGFSSVRAMLELLRCAHALGADRFTMISGQDYPVRGIGELLAEIARDEEIIAVDRLCEQHGSSWFDRCAFEPFFGDRALLSLRDGWLPLRKLSSAVGRALPRRRPPIPVYYGSAWWSLTRAAVDAVLRFADERPDALAWFRWSRVPDEMVFQSILKQSPRAPFIRFDETRPGAPVRARHRAATAYADFTADSIGSPRVLDLSDLEPVQASGALFARKVDPIESAGLMDALDAAAGLKGRDTVSAED